MAGRMTGTKRDRPGHVPFVPVRGGTAGQTGHPPKGDVPATCPALSRSMGTALDDLAERLRRLRPSVRDPEAFHIEKSEIENELRMLAWRSRYG